MKRELQPVVMDILITKITAKTVFYDLWRGRQGETWKVPDGSTFDKELLEVGKRYRVWSDPITARYFSHTAQNWVWGQRYDWKRVEEISPIAKSTVKSAKQREADRQRDSMKDADDGSLFQW